VQTRSLLEAQNETASGPRHCALLNKRSRNYANLFGLMRVQAGSQSRFGLRVTSRMTCAGGKGENVLPGVLLPFLLLLYSMHTPLSSCQARILWIFRVYCGWLPERGARQRNMVLGWCATFLVVESFCRPLRGLCGGAAVFHGLTPVATDYRPLGSRAAREPPLHAEEAGPKQIPSAYAKQTREPPSVPCGTQPDGAGPVFDGGRFANRPYVGVGLRALLCCC